MAFTGSGLRADISITWGGRLEAGIAATCGGPGTTCEAISCIACAATPEPELEREPDELDGEPEAFVVLFTVGDLNGGIRDALGPFDGLFDREYLLFVPGRHESIPSAGGGFCES